MRDLTVKRTPIIRHFLSLTCLGCKRDVILVVDGKTYGEIEPAVGKKSLSDRHHLWCPFCGSKDLQFRNKWKEAYESLSVELGYEPPRPGFSEPFSEDGMGH